MCNNQMLTKRERLFIMPHSFSYLVSKRTQKQEQAIKEYGLIFLSEKTDYKRITNP